MNRSVLSKIRSNRIQSTKLAALILLIWLPHAILSDKVAAQNSDEYAQGESELSALPPHGISSSTPRSKGSLPTLDEALILLSSANRENLVELGELRQFHPTRMDAQLLPSTPLSASIERQVAEAGLNIGIEVLRFVSNSRLPSAYHSASIDERQLNLYNILRSVSTLQGLTYYSASRGETRLLFEESWAIGSLSKPKIALPDPIVEKIVPLDTILIHQRDKSFGSNRSKVAYRSVGRDMSIAIENITPMRYKGLIRVVNPGKMHIRIIIVPVQEGLLIYGNMAAKTLNVRAFLKRAESSFTNRIISLTRWYLNRITEEFQ